jgi:YD repeat-containing protein
MSMSTGSAGHASGTLASADSPGTQLQLERDAHGRLVHRDAAGETHAGVVVVRAFPLAAPHEGIALLAADGRELAWIDRLEVLAAPTRQLIEEELAAREFVPVLQRLTAVSSYSTPSTWEIETDRGATRFVLKGEEDIRRLPGGGRLLIASAQGLHFLVPDIARLDRASRRLLERFL